ncbi:MAG: hypothetical protein FWG26_08225 [Betaproteobacteria bacterium]|nr:hypothetical protein [Betaproteobacteria bacterium]
MSKKQSKSTQPPGGCEIHGEADICNVVTELWRRAANELSENELKWFAEAGDYAETFMGYLAETTKNIGYWISEEKNESGDGSNIAILLFFLAESMRCVKALIQISISASYRLCNKEAS